MTDDKVVKLPVPAAQQAKGADEHARADTERNQRLFDWADAVFKKLGLDKAVAAAKSIEVLRGITLDLTNIEIALAIRDALHPASGERAAAHFRGLKEGSLKQVLKNRSTELKKAREAELRGHKKQSDWADGLRLDKDDRIKPILTNLVLMLREAPAWKGVFGYDEFNARVVVIKAPAQLKKTAAGAILTDLHESRIRIWFQDKGIEPTIGDVGRAIQTAAQDSVFNPLRDHLGAFVWDERPRLPTWLQTYAGVKDSPYVRAVGPRCLIAAVARVYEPGCQADNMLILEGPQGILKSTLLRKLAIRDVWFADRLSNVGTKDAQIETAGVWIYEISEMEGLMKAASMAQKRFLSSPFDRYRPPHGIHTIRRPRQCIFFGTINPPPDGRYLRDPTGGRRFWPVICVGTINIKGFLAARDQLWAEAVHRYRAGEPWHLETDGLKALAIAEQDKRFVIDPWEELIREWIGKRDDVSLVEVLKELGLPAEQHTQSALNRVQKILTRMKFRLYRGPRPARKHRYRRDPLAKKVGQT